MIIFKRKKLTEYFSTLGKMFATDLKVEYTLNKIKLNWSDKSYDLGSMKLCWALVTNLNDFSEIHENKVLEHRNIEQDLLDKYIEKNKTEKGILLKRRLYGIVAQK